jgi:hypothetical protein
MRAEVELRWASGDFWVTALSRRASARQGGLGSVNFALDSFLWTERGSAGEGGGFGWRWTASSAAKKNDFDESGDALGHGKENGTRERAQISGGSSELTKNSARCCGLRRAIASAWRRLWHGRKRGKGEEGEGIYREVSCLDLVPGNGRNQEALMAAVSGEIDGRRLKRRLTSGSHCQRGRER